MNNGSMWAGIAVAIGIGAILPLQGLLNARLGTQIGGPVAAAFVSFVVGTLGLGAYLLASRHGLRFAPGMHAPAWLWIGGLIGAVYVAAFTLLVPRLGVAAIICLTIFGQIAASLLLDHFGVLQAQRPVDVTRLGGALLVLVGVLLVVAPWRAPPAVAAPHSTTISRNEQIEAVLNNAVWSLKERHFRNDRDGIAKLRHAWTVTLEDVIAAGEQRDLSDFLSATPGGEGIFLMKGDTGYEIRHRERAADIHSDHFEQLRPAFRSWIAQIMGQYRLQGTMDSGPGR